MRAAFHPGTDHHDMAAAEQAHRGPVRQLTEPAVAWVFAHQPSGLARPFRRQRLARLDKLEICVGQQAHCQGGTKGILFLAQMAQHANAELAPGRRRSEDRVNGLVDGPRLAALFRRQFVERFFLQHDQAGRQFQRQRGLRVLADVAVEVGAGQGQLGRTLGMAVAEIAQGRMALARMQGDQQFAGLAVPLRQDRDAATQPAQQPRPAHRGVAVAGARTGQGRGDDDDFGCRHGIVTILPNA